MTKPAISLHPLIHDYIVNQLGVNADEIGAFVLPDYEDLEDPFLIPDMELAVNRIKQAIDDSEVIGIYGDYDVDGLTATTVLLSYLEQIGLKTVTFLPDRFVDGYGVSMRGMDYFAERGVGLMLTVDTGSGAEEEIAYGLTKGIETVVTDHHHAEVIPKSAVATVNPKRTDNTSKGFREYAGVGVAFGLVRALQKTHQLIPEGQEKWLLDLVALGTVCDVMTLTGQNRTLVYWGLQVLKKQRRIGLAQLAKTGGIDLSSPSSFTCGFQLGPRLNAAGRVEHAKRALDLLIVKDARSAREPANLLEQLNSDRKLLQNDIYEEALIQAKAVTQSVNVVYSPDWHEGVVGIVASKLVEATGKPSFVLGGAQDEGLLKGSGRSIKGFHLAEGLNSARDLLVSGGGHAMAAGLTVKPDNLKRLIAALNKHYTDTFDPDRVVVDDRPAIQVEPSEVFSPEFTKSVMMIGPFGTDNPEPLIELKGVELGAVTSFGKTGDHRRAQYRGQGAGVEIVKFFADDDFEFPAVAPRARLQPSTWSSTGWQLIHP